MKIRLWRANSPVSPQPLQQSPSVADQASSAGSAVDVYADSVALFIYPNLYIDREQGILSEISFDLNDLPLSI
jgi:hypothetical protein